MLTCSEGHCPEGTVGPSGQGLCPLPWCWGDAGKWVLEAVRGPALEVFSVQQQLFPGPLTGPRDTSW